MPVSTAQARGQILDALAAAIDQLALASASLGEAFELLDDTTAGRLEDALFRPVQKALGRAKRTSSGFAGRVGMTAPGQRPPAPGVPSQGVKVFITHAVEAASEADRALAGLQDSMAPIDAGDADLRAGLAETRELIEELAPAARDLVRSLGR